MLRFWETKFSHVRPLKRAGGRRYYRPEDIVLLKRIQSLLYDDGYTIRGVQRLLREVGPKRLIENDFGRTGDASVRDPKGAPMARDGAATKPEPPPALNEQSREDLRRILTELAAMHDLLRKQLD